MAQQRAYMGWSWIVSLILAIIPITNFIFGIVTRIQRNKLVETIIFVVLSFFFIGWLMDLISMIVHKDIKWIA